MFTLNVGETKTYNSNPKDAAGFGPAALLPGFAGNSTVQWLPQTPGIVSKTLPGDGVDLSCQFTGLAVGVVVVNILGFTPTGTPHTTPMPINVVQPVGEFDHFEPTEA